MMETWQVAGFGIYVHWPFCAAKCPYCDFNSHVSATVDHDRFLSAYLAEIDHWAEQTRGRVVTSVFFGGGTPSLMEPRVTEAILGRIRDCWVTANDLEVTLEANPTSVEAGRFREFVSAGVTRFSVGLQALNDTDLKRLGRMHTAAEGLSAYEVARNTCDRASFDLIYARQNQSLDDWESELRQALSLAPDHMSLYQLTVEDGTVFGARAARGLLGGLPTEDLSADMYDLTQTLCGEAGLPRYEVSNHARFGAESRHNLIYWRGGDWLGIGPGAHGRVTMDGGQRVATETRRAPLEWLRAVEGAGQGISASESLQDIDISEEYMMMSLRLNEGLDVNRLRDRGYRISDDRMSDLLELNLIRRTDHGLSATDRGIVLLNQVIGSLVPLEPL